MEQKHPTGGEKIVQCLEREGVEYIFGLSGGAAMPIFDALVDSKIQLVLTRHEQGATHMADGYARSTGRPGVVLVTSGPGATNTVTGLLTALMDSAPVVVITGQTISPMLGKDAFQEADVTGITYPVVKHSYLVKEADDIPRIVREAFHVATTGRPGPVLIDVPKDIGQGPCDAPFTDQLDLPGYGVAGRGDADAIAEAARLLNGSRRPVLYVGHGAVISGAGKAITTLAEKLRAPVVNTLLGKGAVDETHPLHLGMLERGGDPRGHRCGGVRQDHPAPRDDPRRRTPGDRGSGAPGGDGGHRGLAGPVRALAATVPPQVPQAGRSARAARARPSGCPDPGGRDPHHGRGAAPDVGGPVLPLAERAALDHQRRSGDHGLRLSRCHRRPVRKPG
jgi:hypothetical protein